jgi:predicted ATP-binding protein involved in virulence
MHLKEIVLSNFRCFKELRVNLHPRLTVLVAENGGGKTAILDGLAIGLSPVLRYLSSADQRLSGPGIKDTDFRLEQRQGPDGNEHWSVTDYAQILIETTSGLKWAHWRGSAKGKQPESKAGQSDLTSYATGVLESLKNPHPSLLPVFAFYGARRGWVVVPERLRESKFDYTQPSSALVGALDSLSDFKEMLKWFDAEEASELRANKGKRSEDYDESPTLIEVRTAINSILGGVYDNPHFDRKHKFVVSDKTTGGLLQVTQLSQGYQSMLALAMDFARRLALANGHLHYVDQSFDWSFALDFAKAYAPDNTEFPPLGPAWAPSIMLVDEIDLHLHPSWQQRVLEDLMRTFPGTQFIVTTHSPQVLSTVPMESIRIIKNGIIHSAPPGTDGAEAQRILEDVFLVPARAKTDMARALEEYLRLVDLRQWETEPARELRKRLDLWSQGQEPSLLAADLQIENMKWEAGH